MPKLALRNADRRRRGLQEKSDVRMNTDPPVPPWFYGWPAFSRLFPPFPHIPHFLRERGKQEHFGCRLTGVSWSSPSPSGSSGTTLPTPAGSGIPFFRKASCRNKQWHMQCQNRWGRRKLAP